MSGGKDSFGTAAAAAAAVVVPVALPSGRAYDIHIGAGLIPRAGCIAAGVARSRRAVIITQSAIARRYAAALVDSLRAAGFGDTPVIVFPAGERYKTLGTITTLFGKLYDLSPAIDRKTLIIALGGGVVGDVAGYVAASYLRGLDYIQAPTTLLAMVDSSVGGKTGVDFRSGKNLIGAFHQPKAVLIDTDVLSTLPPREFRAGMAEVVKYGIIRDRDLLATVTNCADDLARLSPAVLPGVIARCCEIKAEVVARDEFEETGLRAILNFGHTIGHAIESATRYRRFKHGEAVAMGMVAAVSIGQVYGITDTMLAGTLTAALLANGLPVHVPPDIAADDLLPLLSRDKKATSGRARFVLAGDIGAVTLIDDVSETVIRRGLQLSYGIN